MVRAPSESSAAEGLRSTAEELLSVDTALRVGSAAELADAATRSHLADGRCVGWVGDVPSGWRLVLDAECAGAAPPAALAARFGATAFWQRWTLAECLCKLAHVPALTWLARHGLDARPAERVAHRTHLLAGDIIVTVAVQPISYPRLTRDSRLPQGQHGLGHPGGAVAPSTIAQVHRP